MDPSGNRLRPSRWLEAVVKGNLDSQLRENVGEDPGLSAEHRELLVRALRGFLKNFGDSEAVSIVRAPGRINLIGMHVDHRGGCVNPVAIKETIVVAAPRRDDRVNLANESADFPPRSFRISEELPEKTVEDWDDWTARNLTALGSRGLAGDWSNYSRAAGLYLANRLRRQHDLPPERFTGLDAFVTGNMPMAAGLSSSSTLVVSLARLFILFNGLEIGDNELIDLCGEAEWYVGTRGGKGDHAAIILSRQGRITRIAFFPFGCHSFEFPPEYRVVVCNSMILSRKSATTRHAFNERIASYEIGFLLLKEILGEHGFAPGRLVMLRDLNPENLGVSDRELLELLLELPVTISRHAVEKRLSERHGEILRKLWQTHPEPEGGYPIRDVCLFGAAECLRASLAGKVLEKGPIEQFGRLMNVSHDGDRVTRLADGARVEWRSRFDRNLLDKEPEAQLHLQPGGYRVSTPEIDELVDLALGVEGVLGARLTGAGYGGCVAVLVHERAVAGLLERLERSYYSPRGWERRAEVCRPVRGCSFFREP